jgi:methyltransferase (TIGR00027 family)
MRQDRPSRTAEFNAAIRAAESAKRPDRRLLNDPYAARLLPAGLRLLARSASLPVIGRGLTWFVDRRWPGVRTSLIARTRLIDDWVADAARDGAEQMVLLGAGLDSRAWRLPSLANLRIFEVDHPNTSRAKLSRLAGLSVDLARVSFVHVDFDRQRLEDRLQAAGFDPSRPTVVVWDGVTNYLQADAVDAVVAWAGKLAPRSTFIFTYVHAGVLDGTAQFVGASQMLRSVKKAGEPWTFGLKPGEVASYLQRFGLRLTANLNAGEYRQKIMGAVAQRMRGYEFYNIARAEVSGN